MESNWPTNDRNVHFLLRSDLAPAAREHGISLLSCDGDLFYQGNRF
jgi:hypothetical protein